MISGGVEYAEHCLMFMLMLNILFVHKYYVAESFISRDLQNNYQAFFSMDAL